MHHPVIGQLIDWVHHREFVIKTSICSIICVIWSKYKAVIIYYEVIIGYYEVIMGYYGIFRVIMGYSGLLWGFVVPIQRSATYIVIEYRLIHQVTLKGALVTRKRGCYLPVAHQRN